MSYTLQMIRERQLEQALDSRKLGGYFRKVISVHPLAGMFESGRERYGRPVVTQLDGSHVFVEGTIAVSKIWRFIPPVNFLLAQISLVRLLLRVAREAEVNVVRVGDPYYLGLMGWLLSRLLRVPLAIRVNFNYDQLYRITKKPAYPKLFLRRSVEKFVERLVFTRCSLVAGANQNNLDYAVSNGASRASGVVFRYGNLIHPIHFTEPSTRSEGKQMLQEIGVGREFLMTVGRLVAMKQPDHNLLVLKAVRELEHDVDFLFVGDGDLRGRLEAMARELGLARHVWFSGNRPQEWIAEVLPQARVVLSPHMGRALTEACLAAAPIVAYDFDWQGEIIQGGATGELVPTGDWREMARRAAVLLSEPGRARQMGRNAREAAIRMMDPEALNETEIRAYETLFKSTGTVSQAAIAARE